jgi:hypothetical protein
MSVGRNRRAVDVVRVAAAPPEARCWCGAPAVMVRDQPLQSRATGAGELTWAYCAPHWALWRARNSLPVEAAS